ncbi:hypothetical protein PG984_008923 [Apiospora sp. TS-2023a]
MMKPVLISLLCVGFTRAAPAPQFPPYYPGYPGNPFGPGYPGGGCYPYGRVEATTAAPDKPGDTATDAIITDAATTTRTPKFGEGYESLLPPGWPTSIPDGWPWTGTNWPWTGTFQPPGGGFTMVGLPTPTPIVADTTFATVTTPAGDA